MITSGESTSPTTATAVELPGYDASNAHIYTQQLEKKVDHLQNLIREYESTPDERITPAIVQDISTTMEDIARVHPDPKLKKSWYRKAKDFKNAPLTGHRAILRDISVGLGLLFFTPFAVTGVAIVAAGSMLYGSGMLVKGLGGMMTFGLFSSGKSKDASKKKKNAKKLVAVKASRA